MGDCPSDVIVPIIFLPGIMGSRLKNKGEKIVWDPDDTSVMKIYATNSGSVPGPDLFRFREKRNTRKAATRRKQLLIGPQGIFNKDYLKPIEFEETKNVKIEHAKRNWGSVYWGSYGPLLTRLNAIKNDVQRRVQKENPKFHLKEMPVYALGYNWSASNWDSGKYAAQKIKHWVGDAKERAQAIGAQCPGAILITHSMGGLVARAASQIHGAQSDIFAVFHIAMPTDGAAATYKRLHFGFEHPKSRLNPIGNIKNHLTYLALGRQGEIVTAILGHMPGGHELLPNKHYRDNSGDKKWLSIRNPKRNPVGAVVDWATKTENIKLPNNDPYTEIYQKEDMMYRAANPEWLFPEGKTYIHPDKTMFDYFKINNLKAKAFHAKIASADGFHEVTYLCYSGDAAFPTYDRVDWQSEKLAGGYGRSVTDANLKPYNSSDYHREHFFWGNEQDKEIKGRFLGSDFKILPPQGNGDGTVPASAGKYAQIPESRKTRHSNNGYEHEPAASSKIVFDWIEETMAKVLSQCSLYPED